MVSGVAEDEILRVGASTQPEKLAAAIANACYDSKSPVIRAIGAGAVNQAVKGTIIASQYVASRGMTLTLRPGFETLMLGEQEVSAIVIRVIVG